MKEQPTKKTQPSSDVDSDDHIDPEPLEAGLDDVMDVFPDGDEVHTPPSTSEIPPPA